MADRQRQAAEVLALQALAWLVGQDEICGAFLEATGVSANEMRDRATDPAFLASVLEFILGRDDWVIAFCDATGLDYAAPMQAAMVLSRGAFRHWT